LLLCFKLLLSSFLDFFFSFLTNHLIPSQTIHPSTQIYAIYTSIKRIPSFSLRLSCQVRDIASNYNLPLGFFSHSKK
jgi:hypothetical protein